LAQKSSIKLWKIKLDRARALTLFTLSLERGSNFELFYFEPKTMLKFRDRAWKYRGEFELELLEIRLGQFRALVLFTSSQKLSSNPNIL